MKRKFNRNADTVTLEVETQARPVSAQRVSLMIAEPNKADRTVRCFDVDSCYEVLDVESKKASNGTHFVMSTWRNGIWVQVRTWQKVNGELKVSRFVPNFDDGFTFSVRYNDFGMDDHDSAEQRTIKVKTWPEARKFALDMQNNNPPPRTELHVSSFAIYIGGYIGGPTVYIWYEDQPLATNGSLDAALIEATKRGYVEKDWLEAKYVPNSRARYEIRVLYDDGDQKWKSVDKWADVVKQVIYIRKNNAPVEYPDHVNQVELYDVRTGEDGRLIYVWFDFDDDDTTESLAKVLDKYEYDITFREAL